MAVKSGHEDVAKLLRDAEMSYVSNKVDANANSSSLISNNLTNT